MCIWIFFATARISPWTRAVRFWQFYYNTLFVFEKSSTHTCALVDRIILMSRKSFLNEKIAVQPCYNFLTLTKHFCIALYNLVSRKKTMDSIRTFPRYFSNEGSRPPFGRNPTPALARPNSEPPASPAKTARGHNSLRIRHDLGSMLRRRRPRQPFLDGFNRTETVRTTCCAHVLFNNCMTFASALE